MSLKKSIQNIVISLDIKNHKVNVLENYGSDYHKVNIEEYSLDDSLIMNQNIYDILSTVLVGYFVDKDAVTPDVYIVLPDNFITVEHILLPNLPQLKVKDALKNELKKLYPNYKELEINSTILNKSKRNIVFNCVMIKKQVVQDCTQAVKKHNLNLKNITFTSNAIANSFLALGNRLKHSNHIFVNIAETESQIIYLSKDRMLCFNTLPFGSNFLKNGNAFEYSPNIDKTAEFVVFSSKENAKNKKTLGAISANEEVVPIEKSFESHYNEMCKKKLELNKFVKDDINLDKQAQSFETFLKHILLMKKSVVESYNFPEPEYAIINMPEEFNSVLNNFYDLDSLKIKNFTEETIDNFALTDYLSLYGALYAVLYNKGNNFADKEKITKFDNLKINIKFKFTNLVSNIKTMFKKSSKQKK